MLFFPKEWATVGFGLKMSDHTSHPGITQIVFNAGLSPLAGVPSADIRPRAHDLKSAVELADGVKGSSHVFSRWALNTTAEGPWYGVDLIDTSHIHGFGAVERRVEEFVW